MRREPANSGPRTPSSGEVPDDLSAWLDGELGPDEAAALEAELERDPALKAAAEELEQVVAFVRRAGPAHAPAGFAERVLAQVEAEQARATGSGWAWLRRPWGVPLEGWALGLAAAAAVLLALLPSRAPVDDGAPREVSPAALDVPAALEVPPAAAPEIIGRASVGEKSVPSRAVPSTGTADPGKALDPVASVAKGVVEPDPVAGADAAKPYTLAPTDGAPGTADPAPTGVVGAPVQLVIAAGDPGVKREVMAVAARYSGTARQGGLPVTTAKMSGTTETLSVTLPQAELTAFTGALRDLGYDVTLHTSEGLVGGGSVEVAIELRLTGAEVGTRPVDVPSPASDR